MVNEMSLIHTFPRIVHLGSYLRQSDAEHPPNVVFLMIVEEKGFWFAAALPGEHTGILFQCLFLGLSSVK